jgi:hypothetical protein
MRKKRITIAALAAGAVALLAAATAPATSSKAVPFSAKFAGTAVVKVTDNVAAISAKGTGTGPAALAMTKSTIAGTGKGDASQQPCVPFTGTGTITSGKTILYFTVISSSKGCGDEAGEIFSFSGYAKVTKGTLKLAKAKGTIKFTGVYDKPHGTFSAKFIGTLTV